MANQRHPDKRKHDLWLTDPEWSAVRELASQAGYDFTGLVRALATGELGITQVDNETVLTVEKVGDRVFACKTR